MDEEYHKRLVKFANQLALKESRLPILRRDSEETRYSDLIEMLEHQILMGQNSRRLVLPNLAAFSNRSIGVFSDYSGEGSGRYFVYSVLVCGLNMREGFRLLMEKTRTQHRLGEKEIAFKDFGMGQIKRAVPDFLNAADQLPGFLCTVAVDQQIRSVFGGNDNRRELVRLLEEAGLGKRKPAVAEKVLRVVHLAAYLIALLSADGQHVFWMTDHDEICGANDHKALLELLFARILPIYVRPEIRFENLGGAVPFSEKSVEMNDLLSIADVAAGSLGDYLSKRDLQRPEDIRVKEGEDKVLLWLGRDGIGLKKACYLLRKRQDGLLERGEVRMAPVKKQDYVFVPIFD